MSSVSITKITDSYNAGVMWSVVVLVLFAWTAELAGQEVPITALCQLPDGQILSGSDNGLQLRDQKTLKPIKNILADIEKLYSITVSPDQNRFAISGGTPAELGGVEVFAIETLERTHRLGPFDDVATDCVWISDQRLVACSMTGNCCLIPLDGIAAIPFNMHSQGILSIVVLNTGPIATAGLDNIIRVWDLEKKNEPRELNNHVDVVNQISVRPSGPGSTPAMIVSVSDDATVRFWQPAIGRMVRFARLESIPTCVVWNRAGTQAVVGTRSGQIHFVDPATANIIQTINATGWIHCLALSPDEKSILVGGENGLVRVEIPF